MKSKKLKTSGIALAGVIIIITIIQAVNIQPVATGDLGVVCYELKNFNSYADLTEFLTTDPGYSYGSGWGISPRAMVFDEEIAIDGMAVNSGSLSSVKQGGETVDYSQTNVQVQGVDEPDIVKTDGKYLYIVSGNKVIVVMAIPAEDAVIECEIKVNDSLTIQNIFVSGNRLVIFANDYNQPIYKGLIVLDDGMEKVIPPWYSSPDTHVEVFDLENLKDPELVKDIVVPGYFSGARLIGDFVYLITTQYSYDVVTLDEDETIIPRIMINSEVKEILLSDISYIDTPEKSSTITNIVSVNIHDDGGEVTAKMFLLGNSQVLYVSKDNIYIANSIRYYDYDKLMEAINEVIMPILPNSVRSELRLVESLGSLDEYQKKTVTEWILQDFTDSLSDEEKLGLYREVNRLFERTAIHRISINDGEIEYKAQGSIPGSVGNQFFLSEHDGHLRVSSTMEGWMIRGFFSSLESQNSIYVLDMDLKIVGSLEGLAPGERIYATRFIGDKCYLVTFRQIDPFFVIDLSDPTDPTVLGELKIPGYSTYLHPYDETHVIGIGMEDRNVKISLFDVSDMSNPVELSKYEIKGDEDDWYWTNSDALYEHKAFLFDLEKNLLVIPAGGYTKQSAYVFDITVEDGIELKGSITHDIETEEEQKEPYYYYDLDYSNSIKRTLYIEEVLYTISDNMVKMNSLEDLSEINSVELV